MSNMNKNLIPKGNYCYTWIQEPSKENNYQGIIKKCPFWNVKKFNGVEIPWCDYLNSGGYPNETENYEGWEDYDEADKKLKEYFGEEYEEKTNCILLFDQCKECGENLEDDEM